MFRFFSAGLLTFLSSLSFSQSSLHELDVLCKLGPGCPELLVMITKDNYDIKSNDFNQKEQQAALEFSSKMSRTYSYFCSLSQIECLENFPPIIIGFDELALDRSSHDFVPFGCNTKIPGLIEIQRNLNLADVFACWATYFTVQEFSFEGLEVSSFREDTQSKREESCSNADRRRAEIFALVMRGFRTHLEKHRDSEIQKFQKRINKNKELLEEGC